MRRFAHGGREFCIPLDTTYMYTNWKSEHPGSLFLAEILQRIGRCTQETRRTISVVQYAALPLPAQGSFIGQDDAIFRPTLGHCSFS